nr:type VI secretion system contractile sheath large subunit [Burkholderia ubonensis]
MRACTTPHFRHSNRLGGASPAFFDKPSTEAVAGIRDLPNWFERAEYLKWKGFRETEDARFLARSPYGPDTVPARTFDYTENVRDSGRSAYLWTSAAFAFAARSGMLNAATPIRCPTNN